MALFRIVVKRNDVHYVVQVHDLDIVDDVRRKAAKKMQIKNYNRLILSYDGADLNPTDGISELPFLRPKVVLVVKVGQYACVFYSCNWFLLFVVSLAAPPTDPESLFSEPSFFNRWCLRKLCIETVTIWFLLWFSCSTESELEFRLCPALKGTRLSRDVLSSRSFLKLISNYICLSSRRTRGVQTDRATCVTKSRWLRSYRQLVSRLQEGVVIELRTDSCSMRGFCSTVQLKYLASLASAGVFRGHPLALRRLLYAWMGDGNCSSPPPPQKK